MASRDFVGRTTKCCWCLLQEPNSFTGEVFAKHRKEDWCLPVAYNLFRLCFAMHALNMQTGEVSTHPCRLVCRIGAGMWQTMPLLGDVVTDCYLTRSYCFLCCLCCPEQHACWDTLCLLHQVEQKARIFITRLIRMSQTA